MSGLVHIVDDDASFRTAIERRLKQAGYEVATYPSAQHLLDRLPSDDYTVLASILAGKDVDGMLELLATVGQRFVACSSSNPRALAADELAARAASRFEVVEHVPEPHAALAAAHRLGEPVLVTGSLYLLGDLERTP